MINTEKLISQIRDIPVPDLTPPAPKPTRVETAAEREAKLENLPGRRCSWCKKPLRLYQMSSCKKCAYATSPPCTRGAGADEPADQFFKRFGRGKKADADE